MSFEPVIQWQLRCNGDTTFGQCRAVVTDVDPELGVYLPVLLDKAYVDPALVDHMQHEGWIISGPPDAPRLLCPDHVEAAAYLAAAQLDGLPFDTDPRT
ncbi:hypothetical protein ACWEOE_31725 [Amycolatopsis sp. NPDC004368]